MQGASLEFTANFLNILNHSNISSFIQTNQCALSAKENIIVIKLFKIDESSKLEFKILSKCSLGCPRMLS